MIESELIREFIGRCETLVRRHGECRRDIYPKAMFWEYSLEDLLIIRREYDTGRCSLQLFVDGWGHLFEADPTTKHLRWSEPTLWDESTRTLYKEHAINTLRKHLVLDDLSKI